MSLCSGVSISYTPALYKLANEASCKKYSADYKSVFIPCEYGDQRKECCHEKQYNFIFFKECKAVLGNADLKGDNGHQNRNDLQGGVECVPVGFKHDHRRVDEEKW